MKSKEERYGPFYPEFMSTEWVMPPRFFCASDEDQKLGRLSPSRCFYKACFATEEEIKEAQEYHRKIRMFNCWRRTLRKPEWKTLYSEYRRRKREGNT